jgi:putative two-component system response regulator
VPKILLVEDNKLARMTGEWSLAKAGYCVISAKDGEEALELADRERPDVVLLDMMLPKLSGPEVLRALKCSPVTARIPVIILTGLSQKNEARLKGDGAAAFVEKDAALNKPEVLFAAIRQALHTSEGGAESPALPEPPIVSSASTAH